MSFAAGGAAANVVGGELQGWANVLERNAMFDQFRQEQARQQGYRDQGGQLFQGFVGQNSPSAVQGYLDTGKSERQKSYKDLADVPLTFSTPTMTSNSPIRDTAAATMRGEERATLGSYSDWALKQQINNIQNQEALKQLVSFAGGEAGVFPYRMYQAQHSLDDLAMAGAAISSIGGGAANYAQFAESPQAQQQPFTGNYFDQPLNQYLQQPNQLPADTIISPSYAYA